MRGRLFPILILFAAAAAPAYAQQAVGTAGDQGDAGRTSYATGQGPNGMGGQENNSMHTMTQKAVAVYAGTRILAPVFGSSGGRRNGLPPCRMDSFVKEAGGSAWLIYGDEGTDGPPPFNAFTQQHRINAGIYGERASGLTTGHGSYLPNAWGGDEFTGAEFSQSGPQYSQPPYQVPWDIEQ